MADESLLQLNRIMLADVAADVIGIAAHPFQITGRDGDRVRRHVPDVLLVHADGRVTGVDVKPARKLNDPTVAAVSRGAIGSSRLGTGPSRSAQGRRRP